MTPAIYILQSGTSGRYYIGSSEDVRRRVRDHNEGAVTATRNKGPWVLRFTYQCDTIAEARGIEVRLKRLKSKKILDRIVENQKLSIRGVA